MASKGLVAVDATAMKFRGCVAPGRWTLCLGAGISRGITPTWFDLTLAIVNSTFRTGYNKSRFEKLVAGSGWSLDAWIQAAANEFIVSGRGLDAFNELIESILYSQLRQDARGLAIENHLIQVLNHPIEAAKNKVLAICEFIEHTYKTSSLLGVVKFLIEAAKANRKPHAIITFNADTLLETIIYLFLRRDHYLGHGPHGHPLYHYKAVDRPSLIANYQYKEKTNIFHCHGTIMPHQPAKSQPKDSRDRLVFLEQEYLRIVSTSASWPETLFLFHAQTTRMVFTGLSMSDANIRRWMSASEAELSIDHALVFSGKRSNPEHLWLTKKPSDINLSRLWLVSMLHLGIRPAWIEDWTDLQFALCNMLAL
jgi:hypothetical protein